MLEASGIDAYCGKAMDVPQKMHPKNLEQKAASSRLGALRSVSNLGLVFMVESHQKESLKANCWHNEREDSGGNHWLDSESCT